MQEAAVRIETRDESKWKRNSTDDIAAEARQRCVRMIESAKSRFPWVANFELMSIFFRVAGKIFVDGVGINNAIGH